MRKAKAHLATVRGAMASQLALSQLLPYGHRAQQQRQRRVPAEVRVRRDPRSHLQRMHELLQRVAAHGPCPEHWRTALLLA